MKRITYPVSIHIFLKTVDGLNLIGLSKKADIPFLSITRLVNKFEKAKLVYTKRIGVSRRIYLTDKGKLIQKELWQIK